MHRCTLFALCRAPDPVLASNMLLIPYRPAPKDQSVRFSGSAMALFFVMFECPLAYRLADEEKSRRWTVQRLSHSSHDPTMEGRAASTLKPRSFTRATDKVIRTTLQHRARGIDPYSCSSQNLA